MNVEVVTGTEQLRVRRDRPCVIHTPTNQQVSRDINPESAMAKMPPVVFLAEAYTSVKRGLYKCQKRPILRSFSSQVLTPQTLKS